eukprot:scaffold116219_cov60-Phaeocystis_antarctica.AAC.3
MRLLRYLLLLLHHPLRLRWAFGWVQFRSIRNFGGPVSVRAAFQPALRKTASYHRHCSRPSRSSARPNGRSEPSGRLGPPGATDCSATAGTAPMRIASCITSAFRLPKGQRNCLPSSSRMQLGLLHSPCPLICPTTRRPTSQALHWSTRSTISGVGSRARSGALDGAEDCCKRRGTAESCADPPAVAANVAFEAEGAAGAGQVYRAGADAHAATPMPGSLASPAPAGSCAGGMGVPCRRGQARAWPPKAFGVMVVKPHPFGQRWVTVTCDWLLAKTISSPAADPEELAERAAAAAAAAALTAEGMTGVSCCHRDLALSATGRLCSPACRSGSLQPKVPHLLAGRPASGSRMRFGSTRVDMPSAWSSYSTL